MGRDIQMTYLQTEVVSLIAKHQRDVTTTQLSSVILENQQTIIPTVRSTEQYMSYHPPHLAVDASQIFQS